MFNRLKCLLFGHIDSHPDKVFMQWEPERGIKYELSKCKRCQVIYVKWIWFGGYNHA